MPLINDLNAIQHLSLDLQSYITGFIQTMQLETGENWPEKKEYQLSIVSIEKGLLKSLRLEKDEEEFIMEFKWERVPFISFSGRHNSVKKKLVMVATEPTTIEYIKATDLDELYKLYPEFNLHGRIIYQNGLCQIDQTVKLLRLDPKERVDYISRNRPELLIRLPRKDLANYLQMSEATMQLLVPSPM